MSRYHLSATHKSRSITGHSFIDSAKSVAGTSPGPRAQDEGEWRGVHVGGLSFDFLAEETTRRWVSEGCPGKRLPGEGNDERIHPAGELQASSKHRYSS